MEIEYVKSAARLLDRVLVNKRGLDLSKEVLWVSVGQRVAELRVVKVGGQKKILLHGPARAKQAGLNRAECPKFFLTSLVLYMYFISIQCDLILIVFVK